MLSNTLRFRDVACALFVCLTLVSPSFAEDTWLTVTPDGLAPGAEAVPAGPTVVVEQSDISGISIRVTTAGLAFENQTTKGGEFVSIRWPDAPIAGHVGSPAVPVMRRLFIAPPETTVTVTSRTGIPTLVDLGDTTFAGNLLPIQAPIP